MQHLPKNSSYPHCHNTQWRMYLTVSLLTVNSYRVVGWTIRPPRPTDDRSSIIWEVMLERDLDQTPMEDVLRHPLADEVDDYMEYKRIRNLDREQLRLLMRSQTQRDSLVTQPRPRRTLSKIPSVSATPAFTTPDWDPQPPPLTPKMELPRAFTRHVTVREDNSIPSAASVPIAHSAALAKLQREESKETIREDGASSLGKGLERTGSRRTGEPVNRSFDGQMETTVLSAHPSSLTARFSGLWRPEAEENSPPLSPKSRRSRPQTPHWDRRRQLEADLLSVHPGSLVERFSRLWVPVDQEDPGLMSPRSSRSRPLTLHWDRRRRDTPSLLPETDRNPPRKHSVEEHVARLRELLGDFKLRFGSQQSSGGDRPVGTGSVTSLSWSSSGLLHKFRELVREQDESKATQKCV